MALSLPWLHQNEEEGPSVITEAISDRLDDEERLTAVESLRWR
jgi:hypothetical protein